LCCIFYNKILQIFQDQGWYSSWERVSGFFDPCSTVCTWLICLSRGLRSDNSKTIVRYPYSLKTLNQGSVKHRNTWGMTQYGDTHIHKYHTLLFTFLQKITRTGNCRSCTVQEIGSQLYRSFTQYTRIIKSVYSARIWYLYFQL